MILILIAGGLVGWALAPVGGPPRSIRADIPLGASSRHAGRILARRGAIHSAVAFVLLARFLGASGSLRGGRYEFASTLGLLGVMDKILRGDVSAVWVTIPEGFTGRQIARALAEKKLADYDTLSRAIYARPEGLDLAVRVPGKSLEGYLFPDTYLVPLHEDPKALLQLMTENFQRRVEKGLRDEIVASPLSLHEILTIAAMIEREAKAPEDRPLISSVIYNRLKQNMPLQIDATVEYALGGHHARIFYRDLRVDSPYNTYRHRGLPPGPIANPGIPSIRAALQPAQTDYLYYVAGPDGKHIFSRTVQEHGEAIRRVRGGG